MYCNSQLGSSFHKEIGKENCSLFYSCLSFRSHVGRSAYFHYSSFIYKYVAQINRLKKKYIPSNQEFHFIGDIDDKLYNTAQHQKVRFLTLMSKQPIESHLVVYDILADFRTRKYMDLFPIKGSIHECNHDSSTTATLLITTSKLEYALLENSKSLRSKM